MRTKKLVKDNKMVVFNQENYEYFVGKLKDMRVEEGLSQEQMAFDCGVTRQSIYNFETGKVYSMDLVVKYLIKFVEPVNGMADCFELIMKQCYNVIDYNSFGKWYEEDAE